MDKVRKLFLQTLNLSGDDKEKEEEEVEEEKLLSDLSLDGIVEYIKNGKCKNIIVMAGAGISTGK